MAPFSYHSHGTTLHAVHGGAGDAVVFVHGGLADHRAALMAVGGLLPDHHLVLPDLRGAGRSVFSGPITWDLLGDDLAALLDHLGLEQATVGGTSAGSGAALACALRHPSRVTRLVLAAPVFAGEASGLTAAQSQAMNAMDAMARRGVAEGVDAFLPIYDALPAPIRARAHAMAREFDMPSVAATTALLASGAQPFGSMDALTAISCPVLVIPGTDPQHPASVAHQIAEVLPSPTLTEPGANPGDAIREWLGS